MKGLSKGRYDETFAGEDVILTGNDHICVKWGKLKLSQGHRSRSIFLCFYI